MTTKTRIVNPLAPRIDGPMLGNDMDDTSLARDVVNQPSGNLLPGVCTKPGPRLLFQDIGDRQCRVTADLYYHNPNIHQKTEQQDQRQQQAP